jgi:glycosyltransferase involved in cell wall biosynthesis
MWYVHRVNNEPKPRMVITAYNAEKFFRKTIESIRSITCKNFICVIVDDGSKDSTGDSGQ